MGWPLLCALACLVAGAPTAEAEGITQGFNRDGTPYGTADAPPGLAQAPVGAPGAARVARAPAAALRGLDTMDGSLTDFELGEGETAAFERLTVALSACWYPEDDPEGEAFAFLEIRDRRDGALWFSGWMIASSPALSALDHPRYDLWVLSCKTG